MSAVSRLLPSTCRSPGGWTVERRGCVESTQALARGRPAWSAVTAAEQTAGRGQATRSFVSDPGGLYITAVLPYSGDASETRGFALAVGWALREALRERGVRRLRLRWPNDLMIGARKVGGILVEQGGPDTLLVGVGLNVTNRPWIVDTELAGVAGRLADALEGGVVLESEQLTASVLEAIRRAHDTFGKLRLAGFASRLNRCWGRSREVVLDPAGGVLLGEQRGLFRGIDAEGRVRIELASGEIEAIPAHRIGRLRETGMVRPARRLGGDAAVFPPKIAAALLGVCVGRE